jgi:hypothetical protein
MSNGIPKRLLGDAVKCCCHIEWHWARERLGVKPNGHFMALREISDNAAKRRLDAHVLQDGGVQAVAELSNVVCECGYLQSQVRKALGGAGREVLGNSWRRCWTSKSRRAIRWERSS